MTKERLARGLIQVYTGDGKGKTTCALGLALRAVGQGFKVAMVQFLKGRETGESRAAMRLAPDMTLRFFGRPGLVNLKSPAPEDLARVREAWDFARGVIEAGAFTDLSGSLVLVRARDEAVVRDLVASDVYTRSGVGPLSPK